MTAFALGIGILGGIGLLLTHFYAFCQGVTKGESKLAIQFLNLQCKLDSAKHSVITAEEAQKKAEVAALHWRSAYGEIVRAKKTRA
jgi:hypothetical protein